jgi:long-chain acyl-CoA synthetase
MKNLDRLFDFMYDQQRKYPLAACVGGKSDDKWTYLSTDEVIKKSRQLASGLLSLGLQKGDKIGLVVVQNRPEWLMVDLAVQQAGGILVPLYPTISVQEYQYILQDSGMRFCFCDAGELEMKLAEAGRDLLESIFVFGDSKKHRGWQSLLQQVNDEQLNAISEQITGKDTATIIYTSGTTGVPKGVVLSHWNIASNVMAAYDLIPTAPGDKVLSFLPLCHIFEKVVIYAYVATGMSVTFTGLDNLGGEQGDLKVLKPHFFTAVPRLLEKVYQRILEKGNTLTGLKRWLFFWSMSLTEDYEYDKTYGPWKTFQLQLANQLIFSKWREALGGNIKGILTGAAACPESIIRTFSAAGIPVREGYGLTEAAPGLTFNAYTPGGAMLGTVGQPIQGVTIEIDTTAGEFREGEGEILATGPNIMQGYYRQEAQTREVLFDRKGQRWLRTGDVGRWVVRSDGQRFLKITDRKKELLKTSGGKYVAPSPIEAALKADFLVEQAMVIGEQRRFVSALIVPAMEGLRQWCHEHSVLWSTPEEILHHPKVLAYFQKVVDRCNQHLARFEQIKKFTLIDSPWEMTKTDGSAAELTPTLKLKRRVILERWDDIIEKMYEE